MSTEEHCPIARSRAQSEAAQRIVESGHAARGGQRAPTPAEPAKPTEPAQGGEEVAANG
jgi:hypothetical protein